jgi:hypothetical protein
MLKLRRKHMKENFKHGLMKGALPMEVIYYFRWQALLYAVIAFRELVHNFG